MNHYESLSLRLKDLLGPVTRVKKKKKKKKKKTREANRDTRQQIRVDGGERGALQGHAAYRPRTGVCVCVCVSERELTQVPSSCFLVELFLGFWFRAF